MRYHQGEGVRQDYKEALKWFRQAAEQGFAEAQFNLGVMYRNGEGAPEDDQEAAMWFRLAAEQGYASAQYNLGVSYDKGEGVPENDQEAEKWYRKAAEQGEGAAQHNLALLRLSECLRFELDRPRIEEESLGQSQFPLRSKRWSKCDVSGKLI